jgi:hypothetical protein
MQKRNEKNSGIEFILSEKNTYADFISILNDMHISKNDMYAIDTEKTGNIFAVHYYVEPTKEEEEETILMCGHVYQFADSPQKNIWNYLDDFSDKLSPKIFSNEITKLSKGAFMIIFGFLVFINISMLSIKEKFQLQLR